MDSKQSKPQIQNREYLILQHTYLSLLKHQQPVSLYQIPIPFVANHIFGVRTNPQPISPQAADYLSKLSHKNQQRNELQERQVDEQVEFDIGEKQQNNDVVKLGIKGMKSLVNVSSYLTSFISKKK